MLRTQPLPVLQTTWLGSWRYQARHLRPSYRAQALAMSAVVLCALVASVSVLTIGLDRGIPAPESVLLSPAGSSSPSGSALAP